MEARGYLGSSLRMRLQMRSFKTGRISRENRGVVILRLRLQGQSTQYSIPLFVFFFSVNIVVP